MKKLYYYLPSLIIILTFAPYIFGGVRGEHLFVYPFVILFAFYLIINKKDELYKAPANLALAFLLLFVILLLRALFDPYISIGSALAGVESTLLPVTIMFLFASKAFKMSCSESTKSILLACKTLIFMLILNTFWILAGMYIDLTNINVYFWGSADGVASRAASNSRYGGIFNQPMESGAAYSLGLLAWLYLIESKDKVKFRHILILGLLFIGGALSVSKVFVFGGIALFVTGLFMSKKLIRRPFRLFFGTIAISIPGYFFLDNNWAGMDRLLNYFTSGQLSLSYFTAGRFGGSGQQSQLFADVWQQNPMLGVGFGELSVYDSAYFYYFGNGGLVALSIYIVLLLMLTYFAILFLKTNKFGPESRMLFLILVLIIGSGFGAPILSLNRVSTLTLVFVGLLTRHFNIKYQGEPVKESIKNKKRRFKRYRIVW